MCCCVKTVHRKTIKFNVSSHQLPCFSLTHSYSEFDTSNMIQTIGDRGDESPGNRETPVGNIPQVNRFIGLGCIIVPHVYCA